MRRSYRDFLLLLFIAAFCRKISSRGELLQQREQRFAPDAQIVHPIVAGIVLVDEAAFLNQGPFTLTLIDENGQTETLTVSDHHQRLYRLPVGKRLRKVRFTPHTTHGSEKVHVFAFDVR